MYDMGPEMDVEQRERGWATAVAEEPQRLNYSAEKIACSYWRASGVRNRSVALDALEAGQRPLPSLSGWTQPRLRLTIVARSIECSMAVVLKYHEL
jgi:hypothetical protein